ncbi:MAG TPA: hypothetical protein VGM50_09745 [Gemmatimonadaceae bacterium]
MIGQLRGGPADTVTLGSAAAFDSTIVNLGYDPGICDLAVPKQGYQAWSKSVVVVRAKDGCHPQSERVLAQLPAMP